VYGTREEDKFQYDKENDEVICPAGHMSIRKAKTPLLSIKTLN
jgi:hypothetical protein